MDELKAAAEALTAEAQTIESQIAACGDVPTQRQLATLQKCVDRLQIGLNGMQTAMDTWSEDREAV